MRQWNVTAMTTPSLSASGREAAEATVPAPVSITPELLATHSITPEEYERILKALGRTPSLTELGI